MTPRQFEMLKLIADDPSIRLSELAAKMGCTVFNLYDVARPLLASGHLAKPGCFALGPACGTCPHCGSASFHPSRVGEVTARKIPAEDRKRIALSVGPAAKVARRFKIDPATVRKIRREAGRVPA